MTMTPEQIRNHVNEVWEDDDGETDIPRAVFQNSAGVWFVAYERLRDGGIRTMGLNEYLVCNNLPQSLRKAKPRMVKAPGWVVWYAGTERFLMSRANYFDEAAAREDAEKLCVTYAKVAIQAPGSDEMEVIKGFDQ